MGLKREVGLRGAGATVEAAGDGVGVDDERLDERVRDAIGPRSMARPWQVHAGHRLEAPVGRLGVQDNLWLIDHDRVVALEPGAQVRRHPDQIHDFFAWRRREI